MKNFLNLSILRKGTKEIVLNIYLINHNKKIEVLIV